MTKRFEKFRPIFSPFLSILSVRHLSGYLSGFFQIHPRIFRFDKKKRKDPKANWIFFLLIYIRLSIILIANITQMDISTNSWQMKIQLQIFRLRHLHPSWFLSIVSYQRDRRIIIRKTNEWEMYVEMIHSVSRRFESVVSDYYTGYPAEFSPKTSKYAVGTRHRLLSRDRLTHRLSLRSPRRYCPPVIFHYLPKKNHQSINR